MPCDILNMFEGSDNTGRPYIIFDTLALSQEFCKSIRHIGQDFWNLATTTVQVFNNLPESILMDWGLPEDYYSQILSDNRLPTEMRLDIAVNPVAFEKNIFQRSDFKIIEANSATPGFWAESFVMNQEICNHFNRKCPNERMGYNQTEDFINYLHKFVPTFNLKKDIMYFVMPYYGNHEDMLSFDGRMAYFQEFGGICEFRYIEQLEFETDAALNTKLIDKETGNEITYLFIHYPNELLLEDKGEIHEDESLFSIASARPWDYLNELIVSGRLQKLPPISSDIIQNKAFFAFLWEGVHEQRFEYDIIESIRDLIPETYCTYEEALSHNLSEFWEKPIYGREGAGVKKYINNQIVIDTYSPDVDDNWYQNMLAVYQKHCDMPTKTLEDTDLTLMFTLYLSSLGRATAISCRASQKDTAINDSENGLWYPVSLTK
jgi:glutathionylspermidine synthase